MFALFYKGKTITWYYSTPKITTFSKPKKQGPGLKKHMEAAYKCVSQGSVLPQNSKPLTKIFLHKGNAIAQLDLWFPA